MISMPVITRPSSLMVDIVAGPPEEVDLVHATVAITDEQTRFLEDSDVAELIEVYVNRIKALHPTYEVHVYKRWTGSVGTGPEIVHTPEAGA